MNARSSLVNQESKGSLGATIMINYVSVLEARVSIGVILPPPHAARPRLVPLCSTTIHHVVSWDRFRLLSVLEAGIQLIRAADAMSNRSHNPSDGSDAAARGRGPFPHLDTWTPYLAFPSAFPGCCFLSWLRFNGRITTNWNQFVRISKEEPLLISQQGAGVETAR